MSTYDTLTETYHVSWPDCLKKQMLALRWQPTHVLAFTQWINNYIEVININL